MKISMIEWEIYRLLENVEKSGGEMNPTQISEELNYDKLVIDECLALMARDGFIQSGDDCVISLTDDGRKLLGMWKSEPDTDHTKITKRDILSYKKRAERMLTIKVLYPNGNMAVIGIDPNYVQEFHRGLTDLLNNNILHNHVTISNQRWSTNG